LASSACARHTTLITTSDAKHVDAILLTFSRFINFLHQVLIFRGCTRISRNDIQLLLPASLISQAALRGVLGLAFFLNAVQQLLSFAVFATLRIVRADYTHTTTPSCWRRRLKWRSQRSGLAKIVQPKSRMLQSGVGVENSLPRNSQK
jgi:hypothetical protein